MQPAKSVFLLSGSAAVINATVKRLNPPGNPHCMQDEHSECFKPFTYSYISHLTATAALTVAFYRAILILLSKPGEFLADFSFHAPVCRKIVTGITHFRRKIDFSGSIRIRFVMGVTVLFAEPPFLSSVWSARCADAPARHNPALLLRHASPL
ncbi:Uncharacterised protein [Morganella morganii]|nr:Uncharacterised protein [Morganella morganii]